MKNSESGAYKAAGVDITAGYRAVELFKSHTARTKVPGVLDGLGGGDVAYAYIVVFGDTHIGGGNISAVNERSGTGGAVSASRRAAIWDHPDFYHAGLIGGSRLGRKPSAINSCVCTAKNPGT